MLRHPRGRPDPFGMDLPRPPGRIRWRWPLPVGFLADERSRTLRQDLYVDLPPGLAALTEPEVGCSRCDLLLLPYAIGEALDALDRASPRPDATCAVLMSADPSEPDEDRIADLARRLSAWGVVGVALPDPVAWGKWFEGLIARLSHDEHLGNAVVDASSESKARLWFRQVEGFFHQARLSSALGALTERMMATANGGTLEIPHETAAELGVAETARARDVAASIRRDDLSFIREREGATHGARVSRAARSMVHDADRRQATTRFILATVQDSTQDRDVRTGFRAGGSHDIAVWIGPKDREAIAGNVAFPDRELPPEANGHRLTVVFAEPDLLPEPEVRTIELPTVGRSEAAMFKLEVPEQAERVEARLTVLHRGRILQTALLRGPVLKADEMAEGRPGERIEILIEAVLRAGFADLDDRQRFDAAVILNHSRSGRAVATLLEGRTAAFLPFGPKVEAATKAIGDVFFAAEKDNAFNRDLGSKEALQYLRRLAGQGTLLYDSIGKEIERKHGGQGKVSYIQILSANPNSFLPVELIYDLLVPAHEATLCPNAATALKEGRCAEEFHPQEAGALGVVCPSGFWGVTKVIERHAVNPSRLAEDPETRGVDYLAVTDPIGDRKTLDSVAPLLFAASDHVNDVNPKELRRVTKALQSLVGKKLVHVDTWKEWVGHIKEKEPPVLLLLSHTAADPGGAALEINKESAKERRFVQDINEHYVNLNAARIGPVVFLIGCDTGVVPASDFQSFVAQFKEKGASLVVGTIAPILGRHASRAAEALIDELQQIGPGDGPGDRGVPFGAVMRQIRRNLLARGILISLALTSYGDADWRLTPAQ